MPVMLEDYPSDGPQDHRQPLSDGQLDLLDWGGRVASLVLIVGSLLIVAWLAWGKDLFAQLGQ